MPVTCAQTSLLYSMVSNRAFIVAHHFEYLLVAFTHPVKAHETFTKQAIKYIYPCTTQSWRFFKPFKPDLLQLWDYGDQSKNSELDGTPWLIAHTSPTLLNQHGECQLLSLAKRNQPLWMFWRYPLRMIMAVSCYLNSGISHLCFEF